MIYLFRHFQRVLVFLLGDKIMAAPKRKIITLECTECKERNYSTMKNTTNNSERIEINKFCPRCNKRTKHKETK